MSEENTVLASQFFDGSATDEGKRTFSNSNFPSLTISIDPFGGFHVNFLNLEIAKQFSNHIRSKIEWVRQLGQFKSLWFNFTIPFHFRDALHILPDDLAISENQGNIINDIQQKPNQTRIWMWLDKNNTCVIPPGATHNIGATALLIDPREQKVMLCVPKTRQNSYNLPGGNYDSSIDTNPLSTAIREAQEEIGFTPSLSSNLASSGLLDNARLMGVMEFPKNQFAPAINQIWAFFVDGLSDWKFQPCSQEIVLAEWFPFDTVMNCNGTLNGRKVGEEIRHSLAAAIAQTGFQKTADKGFLVLYTTQIPGSKQ
jgi:8-oxo-dGTP pyrophosphatase MutT (NUDIX family)